MARCINQDVGLRYRLELAVNGMLDGPSDGLCVNERLQLLHKHVLRSQRAAEAVSEEGRVLGPNTQVLISGGVVLYCTCKQARTEILVLSAPSSDIPDPISRLNISLPYPAHVEAVDPSQDLLVISKLAAGVFG